MWRDGKHKTVVVHRLVANAFLEKMIDTEMTVNHKDGNRLNNNVENLEWLSRADNIRYGFENGQYPTCKECKLIRDNEEYLFKSLAKASSFLKRNKGYISNQIKNNRKITDINGMEYKLSLF